MLELDYFALEPVIVERLKQQIPELEEVYTPFSVDDMLELNNNNLAAHVIYVGYRLDDDASKGKATTEIQQWLIVLSVRDPAAQLEQTLSIRQFADPYIRKLLAAMQGFNPGIPCFREFRRADPGVSVGSESGFAYFPYLFESKLFIT